jgi:hypothetical protein
MERAMSIEPVERIGRGIAAVLGVVLLILAILTPTWWGVLGLLPLIIALSGW